MKRPGASMTGAVAPAAAEELPAQAAHRDRAPLLGRAQQGSGVARAMGCSPGTVKSVTSRGMRKLRELSDIAADSDDAADRPPGNAPGERDVTPPQPTGRTA